MPAHSGISVASKRQLKKTHKAVMMQLLSENPLTSDPGSLESVGAKLLWDTGVLHADVLRQV